MITLDPTKIPEKMQTRILSFRQKLFLSILSIFILFSLSLGIYQYQRERDFRIGLLTEKLQNYNDLVNDIIEKEGFCKDCIVKDKQVAKNKNLRITIVDFSGNVLFDNERKDLGNHADRPEIISAMNTGTGISIRRKSSTFGIPYFYSATKYSNYIIRCSLPYNSYLSNELKVDYSFLAFSFILSIIMLLFLYRTTSQLGKSIARLRDFAQNADRDDYLDEGQEFAHDEVGEISQHIIRIYKELSYARDNLAKEKEKLITHLQVSKEGLAEFDPDRKEIIANNLFIQYVNLISDKPVESASAVFELPELGKINEYILQTLNKKVLIGQIQPQSIQVEKNGKIFQIQCNIFQDKSFEVSINDTTQNEEESRLKRQLTQNIAHELKTPVSSIQGYLETAVNNPDIPEKQLKYFIERSYIQSKRLGDLLKDISTLTRMDQAPKMIETEPVNIKDIVSQIALEIEPEIKKKNVNLTVNIDEEVVVNGNRSLLYSIFRNLFDNSIEYAGESFDISVSCFKNDTDYCFFDFYDSGPGVPEEHLNRLFERFYRIDTGRSRKLGGTGLGLAIVKNAVLLHGGSISVKNHPQGGLEFVFSLSK